jgi:hypothetical protein
MPQRRRRVPPQFSWVDQRLVRDGYVQGRSASALALYLFLVTVADADGLSWYSEETLCRQLSCEAAQLHRDRTELQQAALIAYRKPLYQVLDLAPAPVFVSGSARHNGEAVAMGEILTSILGGAR